MAVPSARRSVRAAIAESMTSGSRLFDSPFHTAPNPRRSASSAARTQMSIGTCAAELNSVSMIIGVVLLAPARPGQACPSCRVPPLRVELLANDAALLGGGRIGARRATGRQVHRKRRVGEDRVDVLAGVHRGEDRPLVADLED